MVFALGVVLFALGIVLSIALHEAGHMWTAQALGMKVRRYFIGFGPTIWSFRRKGTEYGLKAIPAGGFCDIAGMTPLDEVDPADAHRAMYKQKTWKRVAVLAGGILMNFLLGIVLVYALAVAYFLPNRDMTPKVSGMGCVAATQAPAPGYALSECSGEGPAAAGGLRDGDVITAVGGTPTPQWNDVVAQTQKRTGPTQFTVERDGEPLQLTIDVQPVKRYVLEPDSAGPVLTDVGAIGVSGPPSRVQYNAITAVPATFAYTGDIFVETGKALWSMPSKIDDLWQAVIGHPRSMDTPVSVVGASVIGGQAAEAGNIPMFLSLLASLNFFLGAFNILPLLPLDGGHVAVALYERVRNWVRTLRGKPIGEPVNYMKLLPITYAFVLLGGAFMVLTLAADILNPVKIF